MRMYLNSRDLDAPEPPEPTTHWACDGCGQVIDGSDLNQVGEEWYCDDCWEEHVAVCEECGLPMRKNEATTKDGFTYCPACVYELGEGQDE